MIDSNTPPYTSVSVEILDQSNPSNISFKVKKESLDETINKVEVLLNGVLINTYTSNYDEITCPIDESLYMSGENNIEIRAYYFENYYVSQTVTRVKTMERSNTNPELSELINKLTEIKTSSSNINSKMFDFLTNKNIEVTEEETISSLIMKMQNYADGANSELTNLINEITSLESNKTELNNQITSLTNQVSTLNGQVSSLNSQKTSLSSQVTALTNANTENKNILITTLQGYGATGLSTSSDIGTITTKIYDLYNKARTASSYISYHVTIPSGASYGFTINNGWFESCNKGVSSSYALCQVTISGSTSYTKYIDYISYAESNFDYGIVSTLNKTLTLSSTADTSNVLFNTKGKASSGVKTYKLGTSNGYYYVKFIKDSSGNSYNDSFKFKIRGV